MKLLKDILYGVSLEEVIGHTHMAISSLHMDSRRVQRDGLFVALSGTQVDGHEYIPMAIEKGVIAIICEVLPKELTEGVNYLVVKDAAEALGVAASNFYDRPSEQIKVIGITGTNGKTTVATTLYELFQSQKVASGLLSTVRNLVERKELEATHTTPDAITIQRLLREMADKGCKYAFMEVSSHGLHQKRVAGIQFAGAVFTNISHDHLDYHKTFKEYIQAKKLLFDGLSSDAFALVNTDDKNGRVMVQNTKAKAFSYALKSEADYKVRILENQFTGLLLKINDLEFWSRMVGPFNAYNLAAVYGVANLLGADPLQTMTVMSTLGAVEGRFQTVESGKGQVIGLVDYAHTPDALENVLSTIGQIRTRNEKLITVVGCGGDRDKTKRPEMARIATEMSDQVILTSDNPRTEDPGTILKEMEEGVEAQNTRKCLSILDRREAIRTAVRMASEGDIILVAGKGHEKYQDVNGVKHPFDDVEILKDELNLIHP